MLQFQLTLGQNQFPCPERGFFVSKVRKQFGSSVPDTARSGVVPFAHVSTLAFFLTKQREKHYGSE